MSPLLLFKKSLPAGMSKGVAVSGGLFLQWILARHLSIDGVGVFIALMTFLTAAAVFVRFGAEQLILRNGSVFVEQGNKAAFSALMVSVRKGIVRRGLFIMIPLGIFAFMQSELSVGAYPPLFFFVLCALLIPYSLLMPWSYALLAKGKAWAAPLWEQGGVSVCSAVMIMLLWLFWSPTVESAMVVFAVIVVLFCVPYIFVASGKDVDGAVLGFEHREFGVAQIAQFIGQWGGVLALSLYGTVQDVAYLGMAMRVVMLVNFILIVFNGILSPKFAALSSAGNYMELQRVAKRATLLMSLVAMPFALILLAFPEDVLMLFGEEYLYASVILVVLTLGQIVNVFCGPVLTILNMSGGHKFVMRISIASALSMVVLIVPCIKLGGVVYVAGLSTIILIATNIAALIMMRRKFGFTSLPFVVGTR